MIGLQNGTGVPMCKPTWKTWEQILSSMVMPITTRSNIVTVMMERSCDDVAALNIISESDSHAHVCYLLETAMHRCLYIPELLRQIILSTGVEDSHMGAQPDHSTLASLARTCRTFYEPALDALWKTQYDLCALVKCMPSDSWEEVAGQWGEPRELVCASMSNELHF